ncbi:unnamed protein product [Protopolystoma xenopodis]|uniref:Uncharacterized protein n=1 Tax=Protopolystoma xenopodis TaxID=117903 RepID=A0A3S5BZ69_9PLAT|nr:unnamed protein product [Protopolystoma xenopodis]
MECSNQSGLIRVESDSGIGLLGSNSSKSASPTAIATASLHQRGYSSETEARVGDNVETGRGSNIENWAMTVPLPPPNLLPQPVIIPVDSSCRQDSAFSSGVNCSIETPPSWILVNMEARRELQSQNLCITHAPSDKMQPHPFPTAELSTGIFCIF